MGDFWGRGLDVVNFERWGGGRETNEEGGKRNSERLALDFSEGSEVWIMD